MVSVSNVFTILSVFVLVLAVSIGYMLYAVRVPKGPSGYGFGSTAEEVAEKVDLTGKVAIVTGANSGIGKETARVLALHGAHVIVMSRNYKDAEDAISELSEELKQRGVIGVFTPIQCDLGSLSSVEHGANKFLSLGLPLHYLINNAGIMALPNRTTTKDGFESQIGVNHLGHFYLTNLLLDKLIESKPSRVICVSSLGHRFTNLTFLDSPILENQEYAPFVAYGNSKFANMLHARELSRRYSKKGVFAYSLHPGAIITNLARHLTISSILSVLPHASPYMKTIPEGTATTIYTALKAPESETGNYYDDSNLGLVFPDVKGAFESEEVSRKFWETSEILINKSLKK